MEKGTEAPLRIGTMEYANERHPVWLRCVESLAQSVSLRKLPRRDGCASRFCRIAPATGSPERGTLHCVQGRRSGYEAHGPYGPCNMWPRGGFHLVAGRLERPAVLQSMETAGEFSHSRECGNPECPA